MSSDDPKMTKFHYIKGNHFRVIHVDGAWGGLGPSRHFNIAIYNERPAIPQLMTHVVSPEGDLGAEVRDERQARDGLVREVEANLVMDVNAAISLAEWILKTVDEGVNSGVLTRTPKAAQK